MIIAHLKSVFPNFSSNLPTEIHFCESCPSLSRDQNKMATSMLVKDDQNVEKLHLYIELPYLFPNYSIFSQVAVYMSKISLYIVQAF